jgi:Cellulase (glycosyl hydrolase family 5)
MGAHIASPRRRRGWWAAGAAALAAGGVATGVMVSGGEELVDPPEHGANVMVLQLGPVGAEGPGGEIQDEDSVVAEVDRAAAYGAAGVRVTAAISWLCPTPRCTTEPLEPLVERARERGLKVYLHVNSTPEWIDDRGIWYGPEGEGAEEWAALFAQLVARFGTDVAGYEVWNEPNTVEAWEQGPDPEAYADLLKAVWTAAKSVNPDVQVIGGVLSNNDLGYMHQLSEALAARGGNAENRFFYDQLGVHPYAGNASEGYDPRLPAGERDVGTDFGVKDMTFRGLERLRAQVHEDEGIWRDVVIGEFGYDTTPGNWYHVEEPERAQYLTDALQQAAAWSWVEGFTVYVGEGFAIDGTPSEAALEGATAGLRK